MVGKPGSPLDSFNFFNTQTRGRESQNKWNCFRFPIVFSTQNTFSSSWPLVLLFLYIYQYPSSPFVSSITSSLKIVSFPSLSHWVSISLGGISEFFLFLISTQSTKFNESCDDDGRRADWAKKRKSWACEQGWICS